MKFSAYIMPIFILFVFIYAFFKKVKIYDTFVSGVKKSFPLVVSLFPYIFAMLFMTAIFEYCGLSSKIEKVLAPIMSFFGIPKELTKLILLKPFSGGGSLALLNEIFISYGADSYISRCAAVIFGSSETIFYVAAVYFSNCKNKKLITPIVISIIATFISTVFACFICKIM